MPVERIPDHVVQQHLIARRRQQQRIGAQFGQRNVTGARERMPIRHRHHQIVHPQSLHRQARAFDIASDQRKVDVTTEHRLDALIETLDDELDLDIEMLGTQLRYRGQRLLSERHVRRHPYAATGRPSRGRDHRFDAQHLPGEREHLRAQLGKPHGPGGPFDQLGPQLVLEPGNLMTDRRLRDEAALRRPAEAQLLGDSHEIRQLAKLHVSSIYAESR